MAVFLDILPNVHMSLFLEHGDRAGGWQKTAGGAERSKGTVTEFLLRESEASLFNARVVIINSAVSMIPPELP